MRDFSEFDVALEADDITGETAAEMKKILGGGTVNDPPGATNDTNDNNTKDDNTNNTNDDNTDTGDDTGATDEGGTDPNMEDTTDATGENPTESKVPFATKNKLRDNMILLYNNINSNLEVIASVTNTISDPETVNIISMVVSHLRMCKEYLYKTITEGLPKLEYEEILRRYITINKVYSLCVEMLKRHFAKNNPKSKKKKSTPKVSRPKGGAKDGKRKPHSKAKDTDKKSTNR